MTKFSPFLVQKIVAIISLSGKLLTSKIMKRAFYYFYSYYYPRGNR